MQRWARGHSAAQGLFQIQWRQRPRLPAGRARVATALVVLLLVVVSPAQGASAHGGTIALRAVSGPYGIEAAVSRNAGNIDETVTVWETASGKAARVGLVVITLAGPAGQVAGPFTVQATNGVAELRYPPQRGDGWTVNITIPMQSGPIELSHGYTVPAAWWQQAEYASLILLALVLVPFLAYRRWRRGRTAPPPMRGDASPA